LSIAVELNGTADSIEGLANVCADMGYFPYLALFSFWIKFPENP
jgi:hypothetical protein